MARWTCHGCAACLMWVTGAAYAGQVGAWAFTAQWPAGVSLAARVRRMRCTGLADQIAGHAEGGALREEVLAAVDRARVGDARWLDGLRARFAEREHDRPVPVFAAPTVLLPPPVPGSAGTAPTAVAEQAPIRLTAPPPVVVPSVVVKGAVQRHRVMVRLFGQVDVQGWPGGGDSVVSRGLAVPVLLAVTGRAMQQVELSS